MNKQQRSLKSILKNRGQLTMDKQQGSLESILESEDKSWQISYLLLTFFFTRRTKQ